MDTIDYAAHPTSTETIYEVSYNINVNANEVHHFVKNNVNIYQALYFKSSDDASRAKRYIRENKKYFTPKSMKFLTTAGSNSAITINDTPHLVFKIYNIFNSYPEFMVRVMAPLETIKDAEKYLTCDFVTKPGTYNGVPFLLTHSSRSRSLETDEDISNRSKKKQAIQPMPKDYIEEIADGDLSPPPTMSSWWVWDKKSKMWNYRPPW